MFGAVNLSPAPPTAGIAIPILAAENLPPVKSFAPSKAGLFDMNGNIEEWVADCWAANHQSSADSGCAKVVVKGGNWDSRFSAIRNSARRGENSNRRSSVLGFRLALSAEVQTN